VRAPPRAKPLRGPELGRRGSVRRGRQVIRVLKLRSAISLAPGGLTVPELLRAIGEPCSRRTLYRDLEHLQAIGYPLRSEEGKWMVDERQRQRRGSPNDLPFEADELLALALAEQLLAPLGGSWLASPLASVRAKVAAALPPVVREFCEELASTEVATLFATGNYSQHSGTLSAIDEAIHKQHVLAIDYAAPGKPAQRRVVEPYAIWFAAGRVYLVAHCREAGALRTFAVSRMLAASVLDEPFDPPADFDVEAYVTRGFGVWQGPVCDVVLDFSPEVAHLPSERRFHQSQTLEPLPDGAVRLRMTAAGLPEMAAWIAGFGGRVRVRQPDELREAVRRIHREGLAQDDEAGRRSRAMKQGDEAGR
jgi:predicted DNA-binding transcriptional regulator YafY